LPSARSGRGPARATHDRRQPARAERGGRNEGRRVVAAGPWGATRRMAQMASIKAHPLGTAAKRVFMSDQREAPRFGREHLVLRCGRAGRATISRMRKQGRCGADGERIGAGAAWSGAAPSPGGAVSRICSPAAGVRKTAVASIGHEEERRFGEKAKLVRPREADVFENKPPAGGRKPPR